jgi:hypothetical protein
MGKNIRDGGAQRIRKLLLGFLVEESLGIQLKDRAWEQRKTLSELLRDYCRAGLRWKTSTKEQACGVTKTIDRRICINNEVHEKED